MKELVSNDTESNVLIELDNIGSKACYWKLIGKIEKKKFKNSNM